VCHFQTLQQDLTIRSFIATGNSHAFHKPCNKPSKLLLLQHAIRHASAAHALMQASASQTLGKAYAQHLSAGCIAASSSNHVTSVLLWHTHCPCH